MRLLLSRSLHPPSDPPSRVWAAATCCNYVNQWIFTTESIAFQTKIRLLSTLLPLSSTIASHCVLAGCVCVWCRYVFSASNKDKKETHRSAPENCGSWKQTETVKIEQLHLEIVFPWLCVAVSGINWKIITLEKGPFLSSFSAPSYRHYKRKEAALFFFVPILVHLPSFLPPSLAQSPNKRCRCRYCYTILQLHYYVHYTLYRETHFQSFTTHSSSMHPLHHVAHLVMSLNRIPRFDISLLCTTAVLQLGSRAFPVFRSSPALLGLN